MPIVQHDLIDATEFQAMCNVLRQLRSNVCNKTESLELDGIRNVTCSYVSGMPVSVGYSIIERFGRMASYFFYFYRASAPPTLVSKWWTCCALLRKSEYCSYRTTLTKCGTFRFIQLLTLSSRATLANGERIPL